jgi:hypothetical protein
MLFIFINIKFINEKKNNWLLYFSLNLKILFLRFFMCIFNLLNIWYLFFLFYNKNNVLIFYLFKKLAVKSLAKSFNFLSNSFDIDFLVKISFKISV